MKNGKAAGSSGAATQMLKADLDICCKIITDLRNATKLEGKVPADWSDNTIVSLFKGKGDALDQSKYSWLKLIYHILKLIKRVAKNIIHNTVTINEMQFSFCPGWGTTDAIFILRQLQEKYLNKVPWKKLWWLFAWLVYQNG